MAYKHFEPIEKHAGLLRSYHLGCLPQCVNWPKIAAFRTWIVNQIDWD